MTDGDLVRTMTGKTGRVVALLDAGIVRVRVVARIAGPRDSGQPVPITCRYDVRDLKIVYSHIPGRETP